jgi:histone H3/H4
MNRDDMLDYDFEVKEQDKWVPIANVGRIMKTALPENAKISKEAKECIQECVSEFISFITSEAAEKCQQGRRKTVTGEDILFALTSLGFEHYAEVLKIYLVRYQQNLLARGEHQKPNVEAVADQCKLPRTGAVEDEVEDRDDSETSLCDRVAAA